MPFSYKVKQKAEETIVGILLEIMGVDLYNFWRFSHAYLAMLH